MLGGIALLAGAMLAVIPAAQAQQAKPDYFIPGQSQQRPAARPAPRPAPAPAQLTPPPQPQDEAEQAPISVPLPPPPTLPELPKGAPPPAAVIGVIAVPEVMRASTAAQEVEKTIGARRQKLNEDAQKEQAAWRDLQQQLGNDRPKMSPDQIRAKERELQERITNAQRTFRDRNRIIQEAVQYSLAQIERTLSSVVQQVAASRGMNLVLHRQQVALNLAEFDITQEVTDQLNKALPKVEIPDDGVSPVDMARKEAKDHPAKDAAAKPAAKPAAPAPAKKP